MNKLSNYTRLIGVLLVGVIALILQFALNLPMYAQIVISTLGSLIALLMFIDMVKTLRSGKFGVDLLAITAVIATIAVGEYWAALIVLLMLTGGDALEDYAANKANSELQSLLENSPQSAHLLNGDNIEDVRIDQVKVGDRIVVKPGEVIPVDGTITEGVTTVDESSLTGESRPIDKMVGQTVMSGAINGDSSFDMIADKTADDSQYQNIIRLVKQAESTPAHFVRMADRYAVPFTLMAYIIAGMAWYISGDPVRFAEVLVVASPCPLILAAPIALVSGMSRASRSGIIVKSGTIIEKLGNAKTFAFDKTGTITKGHLTVDQVHAVNGYTKEQVLSLAAGTEQQSSHILARSLVAAIPDKIPAATNVIETTAEGVQATIDGKIVKVGKPAYVSSEHIDPLDQTTVYVSVDGKYVGYVSFSDEVRPEAKSVMDGLHQMGVEQIMMISGDRKPIAEEIADSVGIDKVYAERLPQEKIAVIKQVDKKLKPIVMVGDGVNDAPSLATADVGIAMGAHGATAASESADAVVLKDDLSLVGKAVKISDDTMNVARQSVLIGIAICTILMLIASFGVIPAIIGAMLQEVVDTVTILWALRARGGDKPEADLVPAQ
ncbi:cadmium-translocating P-type ATPase [Lentilactobacillus parabuchneri]|jgi:heavy metal translocating P-type ATPase|uniref:Cd(2+)-exporting ATPase n=2 Tax=Lentilactobacillus parabuchneri TaxID=152331 RepID=A0A0R1YSN6_9LACO|nr:heavy metal translocating P-type ATPase [Lentilactobacillus parabuchneri]APR06861.1 Zinc-transporting ATPase [Lentilactobacillus parabuchneri]KRM45293.1 heavy metal translocating P-type ATPase [Lentilactobacillus parabuchneri DSM 5707 = NBRC 107865]KRN78145.1 heavy metal translocating P-type ATPase [Lentilactobacillus parabuchneri]MBW0223357.1 cadmium-translocating P-type ATPase [Lentilactobacillus parabuchneri]MBW0246399.1 cadmium-translocating P-type ATPase [Lentilactobacillus parabuchner